MRATRTFLTHPAVSAMLVLAAVVFGLCAHPKMGVDPLPVRTVQVELLLGGLLAVAIALVLLGSWRSTLAAALALPTSVAGTFAAMRALGYTVDVVTTLALALSTGLLIGNAILVTESIRRHAEAGATPEEAARAGTREIARAVLAATLATVAVFVPAAFMDGLAGRFFAAFGTTVAVAVGISCLVSMTLTPMASAVMLRTQGEPGPISRAIERVLSAVERVVLRSMGWALDHRSATLALAAATLVAAGGAGRHLQLTLPRPFLRALLLGAILLYVVLAAQLGSLVDPLTIMLPLPFAAAGAIGGLLATGQSMSMLTLIGAIMLMGLATRNGILLVAFANELREQGCDTRESLIEAGRVRLRPILATTAALVAGMVPVALARGDFAEARAPVAIAIIGGLISSAALTLVVVPVLYALLERLKRRRAAEHLPPEPPPEPARAPEAAWRRAA